jgi:hypothetical protein
VIQREQVGRREKQGPDELEPARYGPHDGGIEIADRPARQIDVGLGRGIKRRHRLRVQVCRYRARRVLQES